MQDAETREKARAPAWRDMNPMNNAPTSPSPAVRSKRRSVKKIEVISTSTKDSPNPSLVGPASVSVIGAVDGQGTLQSPGFSGPEEKKARKVEKE